MVLRGENICLVLFLLRGEELGEMLTLMPFLFKWRKLDLRDSERRED
jgi:hypothetical protein